ncbi:MAG TPA: toxin-antitoxin system HicB family antitoxin [Desulfuromonadales bacterium]|nr:toxin-antitoxin system HicB family antitoxin [Desulfuromonadales bacterium]
MKKEKTKLSENEVTDTVNEQAAEKKASVKKIKKIKPVDETPVAVPRAKKAIAEKSVKETVEPKPQKAPKDDKMTKFLVSMKKSLRKSVKKEAAEAGVSMNEYIVRAVEETLHTASLK